MSVPDLMLYVWTGFSPDYADGLAFAIANNEAEARVMIERELGLHVFTWGELSIHPLTERVAYCVQGGA
jgi:hypothetical protein